MELDGGNFILSSALLSFTSLGKKSSLILQAFSEELKKLAEY